MIETQLKYKYEVNQTPLFNNYHGLVVGFNWFSHHHDVFS